MKPKAVSEQFRSLMRDAALVEEIRSRAAAESLPALPGAAPLNEAAVEAVRALASRPSVRMPLAAATAETRPPDIAMHTEAIVLRFGRPSLLVRNGTFETAESDTWRTLLDAAKPRMENAIARVGRVELLDHQSMDWVGTGWIVAPNVAVTNRHVAETFAAADGADGFRFLSNFLGTTISAKVDFREEYDIPVAFEVRVEKVLYVAGADEPDIALLQLAADVPLPEPLELSVSALRQNQNIVVLGYPAFDSRNGYADMRRYFGEIYDVKRLAPGKVSKLYAGEHYFGHDCTTLGGNSGSTVVDLDTGRAVGLHFAGAYLSGNFAVKAEFIRDALARVSPPSVPVPAPVVPPAPDVPVDADGRHAAGFFDGRDGYREDFLGDGALRVPLPELGAWAADAAAAASGPPEAPHVARYRHFSVVVSKSRRLPLYAAVNIDGMELRRVPRRSDWFIDERFADAHQLGNEIYSRNDLDRGHMVRRLDPVWGSPEIAAEANADTFHYVNSAPQHKNLNQREWSELEDYILDSAEAKDFKASVITGPVLRPDDKPYRDLVLLPREFWKVAALVNSDTGKLAAAGYILSQGDMIQNLTEAAFVFGEFRTYQVPISLIEQHTGLSFGSLRDHDPLRPSETEEGRRMPRAIRIEGGADLRF